MKKGSKPYLSECLEYVAIKFRFGQSVLQMCFKTNVIFGQNDEQNDILIQNDGDKIWKMFYIVYEYDNGTIA